MKLIDLFSLFTVDDEVDCYHEVGHGYVARRDSFHLFKGSFYFHGHEEVIATP